MSTRATNSERVMCEASVNWYGITHMQTHLDGCSFKPEVRSRSNAFRKCSTCSSTVFEKTIMLSCRHHKNSQNSLHQTLKRCRAVANSKGHDTYWCVVKAVFSCDHANLQIARFCIEDLCFPPSWSSMSSIGNTYLSQGKILLLRLLD